MFRPQYSQIYAPEAFWRGRLSRFIDLLLQQPRLFKTDLFENALGPRARANLTREKQALLDRLRGLEHDVGPPRR
jgi:predicted metal-dependent HD superfamily phosphohydrolase